MVRYGDVSGVGSGGDCMASPNTPYAGIVFDCTRRDDRINLPGYSSFGGLIYRQGLAEVTREVRVVAAGQAEPVGEQLQRDDAEQGCDLRAQGWW